MESYEQAVDLALMVVSLDKSIYQTMLRPGLKNYLNEMYPKIKELKNKPELDKFVLASKILLNDLQAIPVENCNSGTGCPYNRMQTTQDADIDFKTPVFKEALIDEDNIVNSSVSRYLDGYNKNTFNPQISRLQQPLDTLGFYHSYLGEPLNDYSKPTGYGPTSIHRGPGDPGNPEAFGNIENQKKHDKRNMLYTEYSSVYVNNNGSGYLEDKLYEKIDNEEPITKKTFRKILNNHLE
ncbi:MAG: hypothetical protein Gaeavirus28_2 [Gaeavirus sp.]|uniref:Uncharacterized protein n=1 Tax=Gaeavirus sp. TaxID=2487767 RepID=A0A3G5A390_9VIRU|nr:MAG: hypothetical protein Gaeavirus28_2 [Gaeavirus sp.]